MRGIFPPGEYPDLLVGLNPADDAAVYRLGPDQALIVTTDFFTPVVDTPYEYGAIAAANSLSDVYAMGGRPILALNIVAFPPQLPPEILTEILRGGAEKARDAGVVIAGGHTVQDKEPKYGLAAIGLVHPDRLMTKTGARPGDWLVLTKPLGTGVITTAGKQEKAKPEHLAGAIAWMTRLNDRACVLAQEFELRGATDITGYGLLGHGIEMAEASGVGIEIDLKAVPFMEGAKEYAAAWLFPGGTHDNRAYFGPRVNAAVGIADPDLMLLFDSQTSGGLLLCVPASKREAFEKRAAEMEQAVWFVGRVMEGEGIQVA
ncbi:MAG: selenide, water dikinase SelD [Candidatus Eisenbacteria bacterium RBG_16_71_46]|nr:MAG: selenide, water dikinase SelD [Candidatus Eisenbacteria bacterium RBG_16_71_46]